MPIIKKIVSFLILAISFDIYTAALSQSVAGLPVPIVELPLSSECGSFLIDIKTLGTSLNA